MFAVAAWVDREDSEDSELLGCLGVTRVLDPGRKRSRYTISEYSGVQQVKRSSE